MASLASLAWACGDAKHYGKGHVAAQSWLLCGDYKSGGERRTWIQHTRQMYLFPLTYIFELGPPPLQESIISQ